MEYSIRYFYRFIFFIVFSLVSVEASPQSISTGSGNWSSVFSYDAHGSYMVKGHQVAIPEGQVVEISNLQIDKGSGNVEGKLIVNGTLIVHGDLSMIDNNTSFVMGNNAIVIVDGNFTAANKITVQLDSYLIVRGDFTKSGSDGQGDLTVNAESDSPAHIYIFGMTDGWSSNFTTCDDYDSTDNDVNTEDCDYGTLPNFVENYDDFPDEIIGYMECDESSTPFFYSNGEADSNSPVAPGGTLSLSANPGASYPASVEQFVWEGPNGFYYSSSANVTVSTNASSIHSGYYVFKAVSNTGCILEDSTYVLVSDCGFTNGYFSRDNYTGAWEDEATWEATDNSLSLPPTYNPNNSQVITINGYVTLNDNLTLNGSQQYICDTLVVNGIFFAENPSLTIGPNGVLIVLDDYIGTSGSINNQGQVIFAGEFQNPDSWSVISNQSGGNTYILDSDPQGAPVDGAGTFTDLEADSPLYEFYCSLVDGGCSPNIRGTITGDASICNGESTNLFVTIVGGVGPYSLVYTDGSNNYTTSGYLSGQAIPVSPELSTTYSLVSIEDSDNNSAPELNGSVDIEIKESEITLVDPLFKDGSNLVTCMPVFESYNDFINAHILYPNIFSSGGSVTTACSLIDDASFGYEDTYEEGTCPKTVTRVYRLSNDDGVENTSSQIYLLNDSEAPIINNGRNIGAELGNTDENCLATLEIAEPSVSDNCGFGTVNIDVGADQTISNFNYDSSTQKVTGDFPLGETILTWKVTDECGNEAAAQQSVVVADNTPPVVSCPSDSTASCIEAISQPATTIAQFIARGGVVSDNCSDNGMLTISSVDVTDKKDASNPCEVVRTYTVTDESGNEQTCVRKFEITDTTAPVIQDCPDDINDFADENCEKVLTITAPSSFTDGCGFGDVTVSHTYTIAGTLVEAAGDITGVAFPKGTTIVTWSFEDECGNLGTCEQSITVEDDTAPTASCPADQQLDAGGNCSVLLPDYTNLLIGLSDNCDSNPMVTQRPVKDTEVFTNTEVWLIYTDADGNKDSCSFMVNLTNLAPLNISEMLYDNNQSGIGAIGSGQKPFITSSHSYEIDRDETAPENYTYTWQVLDQSGTEVAAGITFPDADPRNVVIDFAETHFTEGDTYTIQVVKEQITGNCSAVFELDVEIQETDFNSGVSPLGDSCQDGDTGTPTVVFWDVDFTGGVEPYAFDFAISNGTEGCTGQVSNLFTNDSESIQDTENCDGTYAVAVTKKSGASGVQIAFTFASEAGVDKVFELTIQSATDQFSITKQTINSDESDDVTLWGVPNTSDIETD